MSDACNGLVDWNRMEEEENVVMDVKSNEMDGGRVSSACIFYSSF